MKYLYFYLILINIAAFCVMCVDKYRACRHRWRISERILFLLAMVGGSGGSTLAMWLMRHKTGHLRFVIGMPALLFLHILLIVLLRSFL
jgi:uncharacterized membrane protein YsdA (DUF1294 family)